MDKYEDVFYEAQKLYFSLDFLVCPALGNKIVYFNSDGFRHFIKKGRRSRSKKERMRRFGLVKYIRDVIVSKDNIFVENRSILGTKYWSIEKNIHEGYYIRVILREYKGDKIYFVSIMDIQNSPSIN